MMSKRDFIVCAIVGIVIGVAIQIIAPGLASWQTGAIVISVLTTNGIGRLFA